MSMLYLLAAIICGIAFIIRSIDFIRNGEQIDLGWSMLSLFLCLTNLYWYIGS